jgi:hypothetical protein
MFAIVTGSTREGNGLSDERDSLDYLGMIQGNQQCAIKIRIFQDGHDQGATFATEL